MLFDAADYLQDLYLEGMNSNAIAGCGDDLGNPRPIDLPAIGVATFPDSNDIDDNDNEGNRFDSPWGEEEVIPHILTNLARIGLENIPPNLSSAEDEEMPYIVKQASTPIFTGSKKSLLNFIIWALGLQTKNRHLNLAMDDWFRGMADNVAPSGQGIVNNMPRSRMEARKVITECGLDYITIDCCPCDNFIYYGPVSENLQHCTVPQCGLSRYRDDLKKKTVPRKKFHYFPLSPRLQSLYRSPTFARLMQWYYFHRSTDGVLRVPADGAAFQHAEGLLREQLGVDYDIRSVFLSLAMDGFNPHGHNSLSHSTWPILLSLLNLPPWMSIKSTHVILSTIIPGSTSLTILFHAL